MTNSFKLLRNGKILQKKYLQYFFPTVLTTMATNIAVFVDAILAGNLIGSSALAAVNLLSPITQLYFALTVLFGLGASTVIASAKGRGDGGEADNAFTAAVLLTAVAAVLLVAIQLPLSPLICGSLARTQELKDLALSYYRPFLWGTPLQFALPCAVYFVRVDGRPRLSSVSVIAANAVNLLMDYVFMRVLSMGVAGSAYATIVGNAVGAAILSSHYILRKNTVHLRFSLFKEPSALWKSVKETLGTGIGGAAGTALIVLKMLFLNAYAQKVGGNAALVALSVCSSSVVVVSMFITGAAQAMIPISSVCYQEGDYDGVKYVLRRAALFLTVCALLVTLFAECFPEPLARMFGVNEEGLSETVFALRIYALSFPALAYASLLTYYYLSVKQRALSVTASVLNGVALQIPVSYAFGALFRTTGLWASFPAAQVLALLCILLVAFVRAKRTKGALGGFYLLPEKGKAILSLSYEASEETSAEASAEILKRLSSAAEAAAANRLAVAIEDYTLFLAECDPRKKVGVDVIVSKRETGYGVIVRDDGPAHSLLSRRWEDFSSADVVTRLAETPKDDVVLGMNRFEFNIA